MCEVCKKPFYITTPIYYPSDKLHIGHTYCTVATDAMARYKRLQGCDVMFLTGADEHGQKIEDKAKAAGVTPQQYVDKIVEGEGGFKSLWKLMNISNDRFIRTTDDYHVESVQKIFKKMYEKGDIYKGTYKGKPYVMSVRRVVPEVKDRMFTVDLAFTGEVPPSLRLGQALRVQIELGNPERVLTIPRGDFYSVTGGQWIYKVVPGENRAVRTFIRLGRQNPKQYEVLEGLRPGDRVITSGYSRYGDVEELAWDE